MATQVVVLSDISEGDFFIQRGLLLIRDAHIARRSQRRVAFLAGCRHAFRTCYDKTAPILSSPTEQRRSDSGRC